MLNFAVGIPWGVSASFAIFSLSIPSVFSAIDPNPKGFEIE